MRVCRGGEWKGCSLGDCGVEKEKADLLCIVRVHSRQREVDLVAWSARVGLDDGGGGN